MGVYEDITNRIVEAIESGAAHPESWRMPWHGAPTGGRPSNIASGRAYQGINTLNLWIEAQGRGYASTVWGTLKQWNAAGAKVKRGERAAPVVFWKDLHKREANHEGEEGDRHFVLKTSAVFNAAQVEGWEGAPMVPVDGPTAHAYAMALVEAARVDLRLEGHRAFYHTILDFVSVPPPSVFFTQAGFASTLLHEACHWTGHKTRMAREFGKRFGDGAYAMEELVAELGAAFLCADLGVENEPKDDHASYIAGWLRVLKSDPRAVFTAATQATKAVEYLLSFHKEEEKSAT
jgi:antirestriction protein ArdC